MKRSDPDIRDDVQTELNWDPSVHDALSIGVAVKHAVATLSGATGSYAEKWAAERAAERVAGVAAVANELVVRPPGSMERSDEDIAQAVVNALHASLSVPDERIKVAVGTGWVTLEGDVDHRYQRESAEQAIRFLVGVRGISNLVTVKPPVNESVVKSDIEAALKRIAEVDAQSIRVHAEGNRVSLSGEVRSSAERRAAERATWAAPGVFEVENHISVGR